MMMFVPSYAYAATAGGGSPYIRWKLLENSSPSRVIQCPGATTATESRAGSFEIDSARSRCRSSATDSGAKIGTSMSTMAAARMSARTS